MESQLATNVDISDKRFDFVIIGGGTAGLTLANRLSENPNVSVVVLEAGKPHFNDPIISTPDKWMLQFMQPDYDWKFSTVPQPHANNKNFIWFRGKGLGGSSAMNFLLWTRPEREDMDALERLGNPGWNWESFYEYSKKSESFKSYVQPPSEQFKNLYNEKSVGIDGPIPISFGRTSSGSEYVFQKTIEKYGIDSISDSLSGHTAGMWKSVSSIDPTTGQRSYATTAYLLPAIGRPNLKVLTEAYVTRIITDKQGEDVIAQGVEYEHGGQVYRVYSGKEVILSSGTIKSPQLLELSGIGDRAILEPLGIDVKLHNPAIGTNIQDHVIHPRVVFEMREDANIVTGNVLRDPAFRAKLIKEYPDRQEPLSLVLTGLAFASLKTFSERADAIINQYSDKILQSAANGPPGLKEQYEIQLERLKNVKIPDIEFVAHPYSMGPHVKDKPLVTMLPILARPFSRGTIHINSANSKDQPAIDPHYFEQEIDLEILFEGAKLMRKVGHSAPFSDLTTKEILPGPQVTTDDELRAAVKDNITTVWHTCGSLSMLPLDKGGVVDPKLKVYGTRNIRVVDLSVLPILVSVHTQTVVYSIAEKAADIIKQDHGI